MSFFILVKKALGCPVEIEFAVNIFQENNKPAEFYLLQIKPMVLTTTKIISFDKIKKEEIFAQSHITLGNGTTDNIKNLLYLRPDKYDPSQSKIIAKEIEKFNNSISIERQIYPSWTRPMGSADPFG